MITPVNVGWGVEPVVRSAVYFALRNEYEALAATLNIITTKDV